MMTIPALTDIKKAATARAVRAGESATALSSLQASPFNVIRLDPDLVAGLPEIAWEAWQRLYAAALKQGDMAAAATALPKRGKATRAVWAAHDLESAAVNDAHIAAYRAFIAVAPIAR